ncbi:MAG TPA: bifunctional DNA-formamidopyrimidine glycosylase/DNA-(apurinic or apyrimidinic site) lyase [Candidatus Sulfotelmatobacter sp.]|jgi:formamidopyrimidine-DNA glycosylase|nr:bifunctional DNA-formamidopyrimidine glycosylase/DNA-(apurinic or apyrimidinic site) lyase [Candidatus Sulfotelmatobacter sp.]
MPELPEVETVCRGLAVALEGRRLIRVEVRRPNLRLPFPPDFAERLRGRVVTRISRRAKYMCWHLDDGWVVICHLGMSGRMIVSKDDGSAPEKHDHVILATDRGDKVSFNDARRFGLMDMSTEEGLASHKLLAGLGPEPLSDAFTPKILKTGLAGRSSPIKPVLLDQTLVVGIGNIYASESLFRAGIAPTRPAGSLTAKECAKLTAAIKDVLTEAIAAGGSSLKDHRQPSGELGYFQHAFAVYDREGQPCPGCDCARGIRRIAQAGRSTYYCDKRQR